MNDPSFTCFCFHILFNWILKCIYWCWENVATNKLVNECTFFFYRIEYFPNMLVCNINCEQSLVIVISCTWCYSYILPIVNTWAEWQCSGCIFVDCHWTGYSKKIYLNNRIFENQLQFLKLLIFILSLIRSWLC